MNKNTIETIQTEAIQPVINLVKSQTIEQNLKSNPNKFLFILILKVLILRGGSKTSKMEPFSNNS